MFCSDKMEPYLTCWLPLNFPQFAALPTLYPTSSSSLPQPPTPGIIKRRTEDVGTGSPTHPPSPSHSLRKVKMVTADLFYVFAFIVLLFLILCLIICCGRIGGVSLRKK